MCLLELLVLFEVMISAEKWKFPGHKIFPSMFKASATEGLPQALILQTFTPVPCPALLNICGCYGRDCGLVCFFFPKWEKLIKLI